MVKFIDFIRKRKGRQENDKRLTFVNSLTKTIRHARLKAYLARNNLINHFPFFRFFKFPS